MRRRMTAGGGSGSSSASSSRPTNAPQLLGPASHRLSRRSHCPRRLELIVVVDGADPATEQMLALARAAVPTSRDRPGARTGQAAARNRGAEEARGVTSSSSTTTSWPSRARRCAPRGAASRAITSSASGGSTRCCPRRAPRWARSRQTVWRNHYDRLAAGREPRFSDTYGGNLSSARATSSRCGGFATDLPSSTTSSSAIGSLEAGMTFVYVADAVAREADRDTLGRFVADARRRGAVGVKLYERHPGTPTAPSPRRRGRAPEAMDRPPAARSCASGFPPRLLAVGARLAPSDALASRWLAFLYSYCYMARRPRQRRRRHVAVVCSAGTAILMYHAIGREDEPASRYVLPASRFETPAGLAQAPSLQRHRPRGVRAPAHGAPSAAVEVGGAHLRRRVR